MPLFIPLGLRACSVFFVLSTGGREHPKLLEHEGSHCIVCSPLNIHTCPGQPTLTSTASIQVHQSGLNHAENISEAEGNARGPSQRGTRAGGLCVMGGGHSGSSVSLYQGPLKDFLLQVVSEDSEGSLWYQHCATWAQ